MTAAQQISLCYISDSQYWNGEMQRVIIFAQTTADVQRGTILRSHLVMSGNPPPSRRVVKLRSRLSHIPSAALVFAVAISCATRSPRGRERESEREKRKEDEPIRE